MSEPDPRRLERAARRGPEESDSREDARREQRRTSSRIPGCALRRLRSLSAAPQGNDRTALVRTLAAAHRRVRCAAPAPAASTVHGSGRDDRCGSEARGAALALGLAIPVCALAVYLSVGNPSAVLPQAAGGANPHSMTKAQFEASVARLAARLKDNPEDGEGWTMLARSYAILGRFG